MAQLSFFLSFIYLLFVLLVALFVVQLTAHLGCGLSIFFRTVQGRSAARRFPTGPSSPFAGTLCTSVGRVLQRLNSGRVRVRRGDLCCRDVLQIVARRVHGSIAPVTSLSTSLLGRLSHASVSQRHRKLRIVGDRIGGLATFLSSCRHLARLPRPRCGAISMPTLFAGLRQLLRTRPEDRQIICYSNGTSESANGRLRMCNSTGLLALTLVGLVQGTLRTMRKRRSKVIEISAYTKTAKRLLVVVASGNPKVPPRQLSTVFAPFFSAGSNKDNVNLPVSRHVVRLRNNRLSISSVPGIQARFQVRFWCPGSGS